MVCQHTRPWVDPATTGKTESVPRANETPKQASTVPLANFALVRIGRRRNIAM